MMKRILAWLIVIVASLFITIGISTSISINAYADGQITEDQILKKTLVNSLHTCYLGSGGTSYLRLEFTIGPNGTYDGPGSLIVEKDNTAEKNRGDDRDGIVTLPNGFTGISDNDLSCKQLLEGYRASSGSNASGGNFPGIFQYGNGTVTPAPAGEDIAAQETFLKQMGYTPSGKSDGDTQTCVQFGYSFTTYNYDGGGAKYGSLTTDTICGVTDADGNLTTDSGLSVIHNGQTSNDTLGRAAIPVSLNVAADGRTVQITGSGVAAGYTPEEFYCDSIVNTNFLGDCITKVESLLSGRFASAEETDRKSNGRLDYYEYTYNPSAKTINDYTTSSSSFTLGTVTEDKFNAVSDNIFGNHDQIFNVPEAQSLYQAYLNKYATITCTSDSTAVNSLIGSGYNSRMVAVIVEGGEIKSNCYVKFNSIPQIGGNVINSSTTGFFVPSNGYWRGTYVDADGLLALLNPFSVDLTQRPFVIPVTVNEMATECDPTKENCNGISAVETVMDKCSDSGSKLGWILCPIISALQEFMDDLYENIVEPMLQINVSAFNTDSGVYQTWQTFQNIANVIFVIIFLFTIFSQITGFGIDNYGIKRLLPKLIIAAILVNLSFIICQSLVDISNILGNGIKDLLMNTQVNGEPVSGAQSALTTFISGAAMTGAGVGVVATFGLWAPSLLTPFLLGLLTALIGLIFMFVLLGIRQAGVIILVIISPVAILMYMLPNTKTLFDRWKNLFQSLLVLYPVCGLMIGGCALAGKVIISSADNFWMALLGGLLSVIPFFLVPKITKGTMSAMGKIGGMITGAGQKISGAAQTAARFGLSRSAAVKNVQDRGQLRDRERERRRLTGVVNRINRTPENVRTDKQKRQLAMAQSQLNRMTQEDAMAEAGTKAVNYDTALAAAQSKRFDEDVAAIESQNVISGITNKTGEIKNFDIDKYDTGAAAAAAMGENSLSRALYEASQSGDEAAQYAATSQLLAAGHHGAEGLRQVISALGKDGNAAAISTIAKAAKRDRNFGELKSGARSSYDFINKVAEGKADGVSEGQRIEDFVAKTQFSKMSEAALYNTDDEELTRMAKYIRNNRADIEQYGDDALQKVTEYDKRVAAGETNFDKDDIPTDSDRRIAEAARLISQANKAWGNERLRGNAKKSRQDLVYEIAHGVSAPQDSVLDIEH